MIPSSARITSRGWMVPAESLYEIPAFSSTIREEMSAPRIGRVAEAGRRRWESSSNVGRSILKRYQGAHFLGKNDLSQRASSSLIEKRVSGESPDEWKNG